MPTIYKFDVASKRISTDNSSGTQPSALYADLSTDTLYAAIGTTVKPMHGGALAGSVWRSKVVKAASGVPTGFAWVRLNGEMGAGSVVKLFADGALIYTTPTILNNEPQRLPDKMARAWEIELSGTDRITSLVVSDSTEGLL